MSRMDGFDPHFTGFTSDEERAVWAADGKRPPSECVYRDGVDVTDDDPATWPWPASQYYALGWRPRPKPERIASS